MDLISRQAAIDAVSKWMGETFNAEISKFGGALIPLLELPTIEPKKGKWITKKDACGIGYQICSNCETEIQWRDKHGVILRGDMKNVPYCPNCGAQMEGGEE